MSKKTKKTDFNKAINVNGQPFRLSDRIHLSSSDKYNDPYVCEITARKIRKRYVISVQITHEPVQTLVYNNSWLFNDMETTWHKYHEMQESITKIRNFVEEEGIKNLAFQTMVKHALSSISSDVENMYETNIPTARQVIDSSTRGNLFKNFPTIPFRTQSGPDQLDSVFSSVGTAENPVPKDKITGPYSIYQHERKEKGLKDIVPMPVSAAFKAFQDANKEKISKHASKTQNIVKIASNEPWKEFINSIKDSSSAAVIYGKEMAINHYVNIANAHRAEAEAFYESVKAVCVDSNIVLNISPNGFGKFLAEREYKTIFEQPELSSSFNRYSAKREKAERAIGVFGKNPIYANLTKIKEGDTGYGKIAIHLSNIEDRIIAICGDSFRVLNPARTDFVDDPISIIYDKDHFADCRASAAICAMSRNDLMAGPAMAMSKIMDDKVEFGRAEVLIFGGITTENIKEIFVPDEHLGLMTRKELIKNDIFIPVFVKEKETKIICPHQESISEKEIEEKDINHKHFSLNDRVSMKPMASNPKKTGIIIDISGQRLTVQWDAGDRTVYDITEALMRLMDEPSFSQKSVDGMIEYSLPGMDEDAVICLSRQGIDPVDVYSIVSHNKPPTPNAEGWAEKMIENLRNIGLEVDEINGFIPSDGEKAFIKRKWLEGNLLGDIRIVIDAKHDIKIITGEEVENYIVPEKSPQIELE